MAAGQVSITWKDDKGSYSNTFTVEGPTLADVKEAFPRMTPQQEQTETDTEFYARVSLQMVTQVMNQAQTRRQQQAIDAIPPIEVKPVEAPAARK